MELLELIQLENYSNKIALEYPPETKKRKK